MRECSITTIGFHRELIRAKGVVVATCLMVCFLLAVDASAGPIAYRIFNHPNGNQIQGTVDQDGYILRLDHNGQVNTFNGNHTSVFFQWDSDANPVEATITGLITHNESGSTSFYDTNDDVWQIDATFQKVALTDEAPGTPWYDPHAVNETYNDMFSDLLADANFPDRAVERSDNYSADVARIYWELFNFTLTPLSGSPAYQGPTIWDEFPNNGSKLFFIQYRWRLWGGAYSGDEFSVLGAAGWAEEADDVGTAGTQDFLFVVDTVPTPEPGSVAGMAAIGILGLLRLYRRRQRK